MWQILHFLESSLIGQIRFAKKVGLRKKIAQISKNIDLSDNYIFCISTSAAVQP